jgi:diaminopimelate decarboxylase
MSDPAQQEPSEPRPWWARPGLEVRDGRLFIAGRDAEVVARQSGTPCYVHDLIRVGEQAKALHAAMQSAGLRGLVRLALKAQREPQLLAFLRSLGAEGAPGSIGIDACSPGEVAWAIDNGWTAAEISYTGTNLSDGDIDQILTAGVHMNVDLLSQVDRVGRRAPGSTIGLRVNPGIGASHSGGEQTLYTGDRPTKFGIYPEDLPRALEIAGGHGLVIDTVHFHVGDGYLSDGLDVFEATVARAAEMTAFLIAQGCPIVEVNTGGGLGVPDGYGDEPLDLDRWASILARHLGPLDVTVSTEPGDFLVKEAAIHLAEVVTLEERGGVLFAGLDTGWNVMSEHFIYGSFLQLVLCRAPDGEPVREVTVAGNINEGDDLFATALSLPELNEGDILAAINVGSYNGSMSGRHCLRGPATTVFFSDRI